MGPQGQTALGEEAGTVLDRFVEWFRGWRLKSWRSALVALVLLYTGTGFFVVPAIVKKTVVDQTLALTGREITIGSVRFNPFTLALTVKDLEVPDRPGLRLLAFERLYANVQISSLFHWAVTLKELRIDNPYVGVRRFKDGTVNMVELLNEIQARAPEAETDPPMEGKSLPPALLKHVLISGARIDIENHVPDEPVIHRLGPSVLEVTHISTLPGEQGYHDLSVGLESGGTIHIAGNVVVDPLALEGDISLDRMLLVPVWPHLKPYFKFDVVEGEAGGGFHYSVGLQDDGLHVRIGNLHSRLSGLAAVPRDTETRIFDIRDASIRGGHFLWPEGQFGAESLTVNGVKAVAWLDPNGRISWDALVPVDTRKQVVEIYHEVAQAAAWTATLGRVEVKEAEARFEDRTFREPLVLSADAELVVTDISTTPESSWGIDGSLRFLQEATLTMTGHFGPIPMNAEVDVTASSFNLVPLQPYLERFVPLELLSGDIEATGHAAYRAAGEEPMASFAGDVTLLSFDVRETTVGSRILQWDRVDLGGIEATHGPQSLGADAIDIKGATVRLIVAEDGRLNLTELLAAMKAPLRGAEPDDGAGPAETPPAGTDRGLPPIRVGRLGLHECSGELIDRTLTSPFTLGLDGIDGSISAIDSSATSGAQVAIGGTVRSGGTLRLEGEMDLLNPGRLTDVSVQLRQIEVPPVSPLAVRFVGHTVTSGEAELGFDYKILANQVTGDNHIMTQNLRFGDKVQGEGEINLPVKLGVSLLTDRNGRITLEFPIEGSLDDEGFDLDGAIVTAIRTIAGEAIKSPFRILAKLGGARDEENYQTIQFPAGEAALLADATERLRTLAAGLNQRPDLILKIPGVWSPRLDTVALQREAFDAMVAGMTSPGEETAPSTLGQLESLFSEQRSSQELSDLRDIHKTATDPDSGEKVLDETAYYVDLRDRLIAMQPVADQDLQALGRARAEAIRTLLVVDSGVDAARVLLTDPTLTKDPPAGNQVPLQLDIESGE